jgi:hypothetical protein
VVIRSGLDVEVNVKVGVSVAVSATVGVVLKGRASASPAVEVGVTAGDWKTGAMVAAARLAAGSRTA